jgi:cytoplasmic iron level regulating protein YaaA (DUF328/UPF0246 family)
MRITCLKGCKVLLIISCGKKKNPKLQKQKMKVSEAYTGPMFQVISKARREGRWYNNIFLGIISAKYGFLRDCDVIENYDLRMSDKLAEQHNPEVISRIVKWHHEENFDYIYVLMGKIYLKTVKGLEDSINTKIKIENMGGLGLGQRKLVRFLEKLSERPETLLDFIN